MQLLLYSVKLFVKNYNNETLEVDDYWLFDVSNVVNEYRVVEEEHILWEKVWSVFSSALSQGIGAALVARCCGGVVRYKTEGFVRMSTLHVVPARNPSRSLYCVTFFFKSWFSNTYFTWNLSI